MPNKTIAVKKLWLEHGARKVFNEYDFWEDMRTTVIARLLVMVVCDKFICRV